MKLSEALKIIEKSERGFMVSFEKRDRSILRSDKFPDTDSGEPLIKTEAEAWILAKRFARATDENIVNIYVIDQTFSPVPGYETKKLKSY